MLFRRHVSRPQLEDDVRPARQDELGRRLHRLLFHVGKDVVAAGCVEHVVEEAESAAGVDASKRERVAAEDEQRARPGPAGDAPADVGERRIDATDQCRGGLVASDARAKLTDGRGHVSKPRVLVHEHRDRRALELPAEFDLALVDDDEIGPEGEDALEIRVD